MKYYVITHIAIVNAHLEAIIHSNYFDKDGTLPLIQKFNTGFVKNKPLNLATQTKQLYFATLCQVKMYLYQTSLPETYSSSKTDI